MMSQLSSQAQDPNWVSIPFDKFSYNTSPAGARKYTWEHVSHRNDLDFVIRETRVVDDYGNFTSKILMKITAGVHILETQDLGELIKLCRDFDPASGAQHPVQIITRCPFLAMRYPKSINSVRRLQFRFRNESDFKRALSAITDLGLFTSESPSVARPSTSVSPAPSLLSTSTSISAASSATLPNSPARPSSTTSIYAHNGGIASGATIHSSPKSEFKVPPRPDSSSSWASKPVDDSTFSTPQLTQPQSTSSLSSHFDSASVLSRTGSFQDSARPAPSLYLSQIERESQSRRLSHPILPPQNLVQNQAYSSPAPKQSLFVSQIQNQDEPAAIAPREVISSPFFPTHDDTFSSGKATSSGLGTLYRLTQSFCGQELAPDGPECPASTPAEHSAIDDLWIPPKRELPFSKAQGAKSRLSSLTNLPPLPKPTPVSRVDAVHRSTTVTEETTSTPAPKPNGKRVAQRKAPTNQHIEDSLSPMDASIKAIHDEGNLSRGDAPEEEASPLASKSAATTATSGLQSKSTAANKKRAAPVRPSSAAKRPKMVDQGTQTQTLSGRDHTVGHRRRTSTSDEVPKLVRDVPSPPSPPENFLDDIDAFVTKHKARSAAKELWEAPGYDEMDDERRYTLLNDFICKNLENAEFLQLCQDTEKAWRRIGLGM